jgi:CRISPR-associated protein Cmr2
MRFDLLAEERSTIDEDGFSQSHWTWQKVAAHQRRQISEKQQLTDARTQFLLRHGFDTTVVDDPKRARGPAKSLPCRTKDLKDAGLFDCEPDLSVFPAGSASVSLRFRLLTPLLTRDDDPFYLFDNPVRKDHIFGVPFLAAASVKGLASDAFQRGFPNEAPWVELGKDDQARTLRYRADQPRARRLFGLASDDNEKQHSESGRIGFQPVWFSNVQYLVMNPTNTDNTGIGTQPIQFEAVAPFDEKGKPVEALVRLTYFNPAGAKESDEATARADLACLVATLAAWWPAMGLGAKRLAGYGAIAPTAARCRANGYAQWPKDAEFSGADSWRKLADKIAEGDR